MPNLRESTGNTREKSQALGSMSYGKPTANRKRAQGAYVSFEDELSGEEIIHPYSNEVLSGNILPEQHPTVAQALQKYLNERFAEVSLRSVVYSTFPILSTLKEGYSWEAAKTDFIAGLTLAVRVDNANLHYPRAIHV